MNATLGRARGLLAGFTPGQRGVIIVAALALALGVFGLSRWAAQPTWTPMYSGLKGPDANAIVEELRAENVQYQLSNGGTTILVPQAQVDGLRLTMAGKGLPSSDSDGYSILDKQGMTATDFQQNIAYQRALESEMSRTLKAIGGVQTAIVHLAVPKKDVFTTEADKTTASVLLSLQPGTTLSDEQIRMITHLVAGSVPGLDPNDVSVGDSQGNLLSTREDGLYGSSVSAARTDDATAKFEDRMSSTVQQMLDRVLGPGKAVVRVNAQLNFDTKQSTSERFISESPSPPPLSEETAKESYVNGANGSGGNLGGVFPTLTPAPGSTAGATYVKENRTVDNAVGKVVETANVAPGGVQRLTVAVMLDSKTATGINPSVVQSMVANAVGLDPRRGDTLQVSSLPFDQTATKAAAAEIAAAQKAQRTAGYVDLGKKAGLGLLVMIALLLLTRRRKQPTVEAYAADLPETPLLGGAAVEGGLPALGGPSAAEIEAAEEAEAVVDRDRMRDEIAELVDSQPDEVAAVIQGWLSERK